MERREVSPPWSFCCVRTQARTHTHVHTFPTSSMMSARQSAQVENHYVYITVELPNKKAHYVYNVVALRDRKNITFVVMSRSKAIWALHL